MKRTSMVDVLEAFKSISAIAHEDTPRYD